MSAFTSQRGSAHSLQLLLSCPEEFNCHRRRGSNRGNMQMNLQPGKHLRPSNFSRWSKSYGPFLHYTVCFLYQPFILRAWNTEIFNSILWSKNNILRQYGHIYNCTYRYHKITFHFIPLISTSSLFIFC